MIRQDWSTLKKLMFMKAAAGGSVIEDTATGNPLTFNTNVAKPLKSLLILFTPTQTGTGDPSPDNVRPISGWTGVTVNHSGADTSDPTQYVVDWTDEAGTVYGGTLDVVTGELWATWEKVSLKGRNWYIYSGSRIFASNIMKSKTGDLLSDSFKTRVGNPNEDEQIGFYKNGANYAGNIYFCKDGMESANDFADWLNGLEFDPYICFEMETPVLVTTLTPEQITALVGNNTIWSDTNGENTAVYLKKA